VFGAGDPCARLMFIGEAPGEEEDQKGEPFVGAAGQLLDRMIRAMGLEREEVYIANIVKCRPPGNRNPEPREIVSCLPYLRRQIEVVLPEVICALGRVAARTILDTQLSIGRLRGRFAEYLGIPVLPTFHPAYLLRTPEDKRLCWQDLKMVCQRLGLAPSGGAADAPRETPR
jgi:DNA polymerase